MSISIPLQDLKEEDYEMFEKHLVIEETNKQLKKKKEKCPWIQIPHHNLIYCENNIVYLPFYWGIQYFGFDKRRQKEKCNENKIKFKGTLRKEQEEIKNETIQLLNKNKSCVMAIYPGGGKCLGEGTKVLLYNGSFKNVENINKNDVLVNEKNEPQSILNTCKGIEKMYLIKHVDHHYLDYEVNESHILSLWNEMELNIIDISIKNYLELIDKSHLKGIYKDYNGEHFNLIEKRNYYFKYSIQQDDKYYFKKITNYELNIRDILLSGLEIDLETNLNQIVFKDNFNLNLDRTKRIMITYPIQITMLKENKYYGFTLTNNGRFLLYNGIITHNTITSLAISAHIGLRTFIIVNNIVLINQWIESIKTFFGDHVRLQLLTAKNKIIQGCQFYIMNAINVSKREIKEYDQLNIGLVIVDECHLIMTKIFSKSLHKLCPRYLLGLSATPFRPDGFDILLELYFGIKKVVRKLYHPHKVHVIETKIKINPEKDKNQNIIWTSVIDQQVNHENRNKIIIDLCQKHADRNILILTKRIKQIEYLQTELEKLNINVTSMKDNDIDFDKNARVLIATFKKVGTGFSHDKLNMLILACDTEEYFMQYLGRVFRTPDVDPYIFDLVDSNPILRKHFLTRKKIYLESGGIIS